MKKSFYLISIILMLIVFVIFMPNKTKAADITVTNAEELATALGNASVKEGKVTLNGKATLGNPNEPWNDILIIIDAENKELEIDLAGNTIEAITMREMFYLKSGTLIFSDSVGGGKVVSDNEQGYTMFIMAGGDLVINSGEFTSYSDIINCMKGSITINGGSFKSLNSTAIFLNIHDNYDCETIINGGIFTGKESACYVNVGDITINEGTFVGENHAIQVSNWTEANLKIKGGTFEGTKSALNISNDDTLVTLSGGKFTATSTDEGENYGAISIMTTSYSSEQVDKYSPLNLLEEGYTFYDDATIELKKVISNSYYTQYFYGTKSIVTVDKIKYNIEVEEDSNGTVIVNKQASKDEKIQIETIANSGYELDTIIVKTKSGQEITLTNNTFVMPGEDVKISATFKNLPEQSKIDEKDETPKTGNPIILIDKVVILLGVAFIGFVVMKKK